METKTKQVQVRLTPEVHRKLKSALALDDKKMVDFFNEAANAYLTDQLKYNTVINDIIGGHQNG